MSFLKPIASPLAATLLGLAALASVTGCTATVTARPTRTAVLYSHPVVYVDDTPAGIYESPAAYYRGRPAYLVDGRWYYESDGGWVYFSDEPSELRRARTQRTFVRVQSDAPNRHYVEQRPVRRRYVERPVEQPTETRRRRID